MRINVHIAKQLLSFCVGGGCQWPGARRLPWSRWHRKRRLRFMQPNAQIEYYVCGNLDAFQFVAHERTILSK